MMTALAIITVLIAVQCPSLTRTQVPATCSPTWPHSMPITMATGTVITTPILFTVITARGTLVLRTGTETGASTATQTVRATPRMRGPFSNGMQRFTGLMSGRLTPRNGRTATGTVSAITNRKTPPILTVSHFAKRRPTTRTTMDTPTTGRSCTTAPTLKESNSMPVQPNGGTQPAVVCRCMPTGVLTQTGTATRTPMCTTLTKTPACVLMNSVMPSRPKRPSLETETVTALATIPQALRAIIAPMKPVCSTAPTVSDAASSTWRITTVTV